MISIFHALLLKYFRLCLISTVNSLAVFHLVSGKIVSGSVDENISRTVLLIPGAPGGCLQPVSNIALHDSRDLVCDKV